MFYKGRSTPKSNNESKKRKSFADRTNSTNIISDKPISYMVSNHFFLTYFLITIIYLKDRSAANLFLGCRIFQVYFNFKSNFSSDKS